jgi:glyceraldehyde 3-phosphate dehydrogenase
MNIAINGFGRIGKNFLWALLQDKNALKNITIAAINSGPSSKELLAHFFKYDSILGAYPGTVEYKNTMLCIDNIQIPHFTEINVARLPWKSLQIDWVVDCSGKFTYREKALEHLKAGAKRVLISAPAHDEDITIIPGVNDSAFNKDKHIIISLGSCTTNALLPILKVLKEDCGLQQGLMSTVHAYTNSQVILDSNHTDPRRSRAAAVNIIPTTTGASESVGHVFPELAGAIKATSLRVPVDIVSLIDLTFVSNKQLTVEELKLVFRRAADSNTLKGIIGYTDQPLVSSDFIGNSHSVVIDALLLQAQGPMGKVFGWYDNEWGYSQRLKDFLMIIKKS